jgi:DNA topoisomerase-3
VSQRTRRPFKAFLVRGKDGKISFEFEERKGKPAAGAKSASASDGANQPGEVELKTSAKAPARKAVAKKAVAKKVAAKRATVRKAA